MFEKGNKFGNRFSSTNQPDHNGRKPKLYNELKARYHIDKGEFKEIINTLLQFNDFEMKRVCENPETPQWIRNICFAMKKDNSKGSINTLNQLIDILWGKGEIHKIDIKETREPIQIEIIDKTEDVSPTEPTL